MHNAVGLIFTPLGVATAYYLTQTVEYTDLFAQAEHDWFLGDLFCLCLDRAPYVARTDHALVADGIDHLFVQLDHSGNAAITNFFGTFAAAPQGRRLDGPIPKLLLMGTVYYIFTCLQGPFQAIRSVNVS